MFYPSPIQKRSATRRPHVVRVPPRAFRNHRRFIRSQPCAVGACAALPIECTHVRLGFAAGLAQKPPDWMTIPLCHAHHSQQHDLGHREFDRRHGLDSAALAKEYARRSPDAAMQKAIANKEN